MDVFGRFGDIFLHQEDSYVFLAATQDAIYAAKILNEDLTKRVIELDNRRSACPDDYRTSGSRLYCYTVLTTESYSGRAAIVDEGKGQRPSIDFIGKSINTEDQKSLKDVILERNSNLPIILKTIVRGLDIS
jgi:hypothetical protein